MIRRIFHANDRVEIRGVAYRDPMPEHQGWRFRSEQDREIARFSDEEIDNAVRSDKLRVYPRYHSTENQYARSAGTDPGIDRLSTPKAVLLEERIFHCEQFRKAEKLGNCTRSRKSMAAMLAQIAEAWRQRFERVSRSCPVKIPLPKRRSIRSLRRWLQAYEAYGALGLRSRYRTMGNARPRIGREVLALMRPHIEAFADERRPTQKSCYRDFCDAVDALNLARVTESLPRLPKPSISKFRQLLRRENQFEQYARRHGVDAARRKFYAATQGIDVTFPLERVEMDEWPIDLQTLLTDGVIEKMSKEEIAKLERARWSVTVAIDVASRYILAMTLSPTPSSAAAIKTLKMAMMDRTPIAEASGAASSWSGCGRIVELAVDNGSALIDAQFRQAASDLGICMTWTVAAVPQLRGTIERLFGTVHLTTIAPFTGRTFGNSVARGDYDSEGRAALTPAELAKALVLGQVDIYHHSPHQGLGGETPFNAWNRLVEAYGLPAPPARIELLAAFGIEERVATGIRGVRYANFWYHSEELQRHRLAHGDGDVDIRVDVDLLSSIAIKLGDVWALVPAVDQEFAGVSLDTWQREASFLRKRFADEAEVSRPIVARALAELRRMAGHAIARAGITLQPASDEAIRAAAENTLLTFGIRNDDGSEVASGASDAFLSRRLPTGNLASSGPATDGNAAGSQSQKSSLTTETPRLRLED